jgi:hypothetical protein
MRSGWFQSSWPDWAGREEEEEEEEEEDRGTAEED